MTKFLNISTDTTLGGNSPSDEIVSSQKAIKSYADGKVAKTGDTMTGSLTIQDPIDNSAYFRYETTGGEYIDIIGDPDNENIYFSDSQGHDVELPLYDSGTIALTHQIPTVNDATLTITQGGVTKGTFTANASSNVTIALDAGGGSDSSYHPDLFDVKWADHICNDVQWLRADTFSWQSGAVYQVAYQHLADDIDGKTLQSETVAGTTIQFYLADDGHKICPASEESNVSAIYNATGVAWYYIIDTANTRFKLPRTQFAFTGIRNGVGAFVEAGLPNITGSFSTASDKNLGTGAFSWTTDRYATNGGGAGGQWGINFSAQNSNSIYGNSDTVQPKATEMYLYFYVGNFTQTALENTAGLNAELFNQKADLDLSNAVLTSTFAQLLLNAGIDVVVERQLPTAENNYTWYRKYKSGWVEQGGRTTTSNQTITFPIAFADIPNMTWGLCTTRNNAASYDREIFFGSITATNFISGSRLNDAVSPGYMWHAVGIAAN